MNEDRPYDESTEQRRRVREAMDACRPVPPGEPVEDLNQPELEFLAAQFGANPQDRERLQRVQKFDRQIQGQLNELPVPEGLAEQILEALDQETDSSTADSASDLVDAALADRDLPSGEVRPAVVQRPSSGLKWLVGGSIAAAIAFLVVSMLQPSQSLLVDDVHRAALKGFETIPVEGKEQDQLISEYPRSPLISPALETRVSQLKGFLDRTGAVYTLTTQHGSHAELLVVHLNSEELQTDIPIGRPKKKPFNTQGLSILAWREGGLLYVLIVPDEGRNRDPIQQFLDLDGTGPIAVHRFPMSTFAWA